MFSNISNLKLPMTPRKPKHLHKTNGRPSVFKTPEEMQVAIDSYFDSCWELDDKDKKVNIRPYTITGLANALGICRQALLDYEDKPNFIATVKRAKAEVAQYVEEYLFTGKNQTGAIFNLKNNFNWKDQTQTDLTSNGESVNFYLPKKDDLETT